VEDALKSEEPKTKVFVSCGYGGNADTGFSAGSFQLEISWNFCSAAEMEMKTTPRWVTQLLYTFGAGFYIATTVM